MSRRRLLDLVSNKKITMALNFGFILIFSSPFLMTNLACRIEHFSLEISVLENSKSFFQLKRYNDPMSIPPPDIASKMTKKSDDVKLC